MTSRRRLTTDELITELITEIRNDRMAATKRDERIEAELTGIRIALNSLQTDFLSHREHAISEASDVREQIRTVADYAGVTIPHTKNGR